MFRKNIPPRYNRAATDCSLVRRKIFSYSNFGNEISQYTFRSRSHTLSHSLSLGLRLSRKEEREGGRERERERERERDLDKRKANRLLTSVSTTRNALNKRSTFVDDAFEKVDSPAGVQGYGHFSCSI